MKCFTTADINMALPLTRIMANSMIVMREPPTYNPRFPRTRRGSKYKILNEQKNTLFVPSCDSINMRPN